MGTDGIHDLTAAYALDALDADERVAYEEHLRGCAACRDDLARLREPAAALAFGTPAASPPPALRERVLDAARAERVVKAAPDDRAVEAAPSERRRVIAFPRWRPRVTYALAAVTAAAAAVAVGLGLRAHSLDDELTRSRAALEVLADPRSRTIVLNGARGRVVVDPEGRAALVVAELAPAPEGKTYEAWVVEGGEPVPAGLFEALEEDDVVLLSQRVRPGATVAVTIEPDGGSDRPTGDPLFTASV